MNASEHSPTSMPANPERLPLSRGQRILRYVGAVILSCCAVMVVLGPTILAERLRGPQFLLYWSWCLLLTVVAIVIALWDMLLVRRASKRSRQELFQRQFMSEDLVEKLRKKPTKK
jgi:NADH:ubiquinone oxidoreductase subunit 6 (subunit J)